MTCIMTSLSKLREKSLDSMSNCISESELLSLCLSEMVTCE